MWLANLSKKLGKTRRSLRGQVLRGSAVGLLLVPALLGMIVVGGALFGYRSISIQGTSMEPALRDGDALWVKYLDADEVGLGDVVTLPHSGEGLITHRVVGVELLPKGSYLVVTKGDNNQFAEAWEISADTTVAVTFARVRFVGYVLEFLNSLFGRALLIGAAVATVIAILVRRARMASGEEQPPQNLTKSILTD